MAITSLPTAPLITDDVNTFNSRAFALVAALGGFVSDVNNLIPSISAAYPSALSALGAANFKGDWAALTGALNIPASCSYAGRVWLLTANLGNVTTAQPGVSASWLDITPTRNCFQNRVINGEMRIDQRNAGALITNPAGGAYLVDRWMYGCSQVNKFNAQQNLTGITAPPGFPNFLGVVSNSSYSVAAGDSFTLAHPIEGNNVVDLGFGTAAAQTCVLSFRAISSLTGTFGGVVRNSNATRCYPFSFNIPTAGVWTTVAIVVPGDTSGTWAMGTGVGLSVLFSLGMGSTYCGTAGAWVGTNIGSVTGAVNVVGTAGAAFAVTGVRFEPGMIANSSDVRAYAQELLLCQRYCQWVPFSRYTIVAGAAYSEYWSVPLKCPMRTVPTFAALVNDPSGSPSTVNTASNAFYPAQSTTDNAVAAIVSAAAGAMGVFSYRSLATAEF